jgi:hypothetical protein
MDAKQEAALLDEAIEFLDDLKGRFDMFEGQRYWRLKKKIVHYKRLSNLLQIALSTIDTTDDHGKQ